MRIGSLEAKGQAIFDSGSAGAPSITFDGSLTAGLYASGAGKVNISVGAGSNVFELETTGKLTLVTGYDSLLPLGGVAGDEQAVVTKKWVEDNFALSTGTGTIGLSDLDDVNLSGISAGDYLYWSGSEWQNRNATQVQSDLSLVPGTDVQAWDAQLDDLAGLSPTLDNFIVGDGGNWTQETPAQARTSLGLEAGGAGDIWVEKAGDTMTGNLVMTTGTDITLPDLPTAATHAANKSYVDSVVTSGAQWVDPISNPDLVGIADDEPTAAATGYGTEEGAPLVSGLYIAYGGSYPQYWKNTDIEGAVVTKNDNGGGGTDTIVVSGDLTSDLAISDKFILDGSSSENGVYTVSAISYSAPNTTITTTEDFDDNTGAVGTVYGTWEVDEYDAMHWTFGNWEISSNIDSASPTRFGVGIFTDAIDNNHPLPVELKDGQDETNYDGTGDNGTFSGGTGHANSDVITMSDGSTITVDNNAAGVVTEFTVTTVGLGTQFPADGILTQSNTTGSGTGFTLTPGLVGGANVRRDPLTDDIAVYVAGLSGNPLRNDAWEFPHGKACGCTYAVDTVTSATKTWVISSSEGDLTNIFFMGNEFVYAGGTSSNGTYTIDSSSWTGSNTEVVVQETVPSNATGGTVESPIRDGITTLVNNENDSHFGQSFLYNQNDMEWYQISGPGAVDAGIGLYYSGTTLNVALGAGILELPSDEVGLDIEGGKAVQLTSTGTAGQLTLVLDGSTLSQSGSGLEVAAAGITETELNASVAGSGLVGGAGSPLAVNPGQGVMLTGDLVELDINTTFFQFTGGSPNGELDLVNGSITAAKLADDYVDVTGDTMTGDLVMDGANPAIAQILGDGAAPVGEPAYSFAGDDNTGFYSVGGDQIGVSTGGVLRSTYSTTDITNTVPTRNPLGAVGAPSVTFAGDTDTGMWSSAANNIDFSTNGALRFQIEDDGTLNVGASTTYETLVTNDDDIPNKKYVDDAIGAVSTTSIVDTDLDTKVDVEEGGDDDTVRIDVGNTPAGYGAVADILVLNSAGWTVGMGTANTAATVGAPISFTAGGGNTSGNGGAVNITAGLAGATGNGGAASLTGGAGGATSGDGGAATLQGGDATTSGSGGDANVYAGTGASVGGTARLKGGNSTGSDAGGAVAITGGTGGATGAGGTVSIDGGSGGATGAGGAINISGGNATGDEYGGGVTITTGDGYKSGDFVVTIPTSNGYTGGSVDIRAGVGASGHGGGYVEIFAGNGDTQGGVVHIEAGDAINGTTPGSVVINAGNSSFAGSNGAPIQLNAGNGIATGGNITLNTGSGTTDGVVEISSSSISASGTVRIRDNSGGQYVGLTAPATVTSYTLTYPDAAPGGVGYLLAFNASGVGSFVDPTTVGGDSSRITDGDAGNAETFISTADTPNTITSQVGTGTNHNASQPIRAAADATGVVLTASDATAASGVAGSAIAVNAGDGDGAGAGGAIALTSGAGDTTGVGGAVTITSGAGGSSSGDGGALTLQGGYGVNGADVSINGGGASTGTGGDVSLSAGDVDNGTAGGAVSISGGTGNTAGAGGAVGISGGAGIGASAGGDVSVTAGDSASGNAGSVILKAGDSTGTVGHIEFSTSDTADSVTARFLEASSIGTSWIGLKAPASVSTNRTWTLPQTAPVLNNVLITDGSGNLSFADLGTLAGSTIALGELSNVDTPLTPTSTTPFIYVGDGSNYDVHTLVAGTNITGVPSGTTYTLNVDDAFIANQSGDIFGDTGSGTWTVASGSNLAAASGAQLKMVDLPTTADDVANKSYVDSIAAGLDPKESVRVATTADLTGVTWGSPSFGYTAGSGGTGAFVDINLSAAVDGETLAINDRVLVKDQANAKQNGLFVVKTGNSFPTQALLERAPDHDGSPSNEVSGGNHTFVEAGTYADTGWIVTGVGTLTFSTNGSDGDDINWTQFTGAGSFTAGLGISQSGSVIDLDVNDLAASTIISSDFIAFHDDSAVASGSGSKTRKITAANFISDLNILTGTAGGALTATDGVRITASDVIELDFTNLPSATIAGIDLLAFDNGATGSHANTTVSDFLSDLNITNRAYTSTGMVTHTADDTWGVATISASATIDELGIAVNNGDGGTGSITVGLDIVGLTALGSAPASNDVLPIYDVTGTVNRKVTIGNIADGIAASTNIGELADVEAPAYTAGTVLVADGTDSWDQKKIQHIESVTSQTSIAINHAIGQKFVIVQCYDNSDQMVVPQSVTLTDADNCTVTFSPAFSGNVVVMGVPGA